MTQEKSVALDTKTLSAEGKSLLAALKSDIVGQDRALMAVVMAMEIARSPLRRKDRPLAAFLCLGPTGTGKTSLPKALAKHLFGSEHALTFVPLNNFSEDHRISSLEGSPPGYEEHLNPNDPRNAFNRRPPLRQWNLDRHHHAHLAKIHAEEIKYWKKISGKTKMLGNELEDLAQLEKSVENEIGLIKEAIENFPKASDSDVKLQELRKNMAAKEADLKELKSEQTSKFPELQKLNSEARKIYSRATREGWIYNPRKPSTQLMSIVVFDEVEKAHATVLNHLLTIMAEGSTQLANGEEPSFRNSLLFMTSNVGQEEMDPDKKVGFRKYSPGERDRLIDVSALSAAKKAFPREFFGRFSGKLVFRSLSREQLMQVFDIQVRKLHDRLKEKDIPLLVKPNEAVKNCLVDLAMKSKEEGVRILEYHFHDKVVADLAVCFNTKQLANPGEIRITLLSDGDEPELSYQYFPNEKPATS